MSVLVQQLCFPSLKEDHSLDFDNSYVAQQKPFSLPCFNSQNAVCMAALKQNDCSVAPQAKSSLRVRQPDDTKIQDYHIAYMSFPLAFSYISHKFTSTPGLQFSPHIVTCNQRHDDKDVIVNGRSHANVNYTH